MTLLESIEVRELRKRLAKNHRLSAAEVARAREIMAHDPGPLRHFEEELAAQTVYRSGAKDSTAAERQRRHRAKAADIGNIQPPASMERREKYRYDLCGFGVEYFCGYPGALLDHEPSELIVESLVKPLQNVILHGGQNVILFSRSAGKTTWEEIAVVWAFFYGHKRFIETVCATRDFAKAIREDVFEALSSSPRLYEDFPFICGPIRALEGNRKLAPGQRYEGRPTGLSLSGGYFVLPTVYWPGTDEPADEGCGAILYAAGIRGAVRGIKVGARRPDLFLLDDPQTRGDAKSVKKTDELEKLIQSDILGGGRQVDVKSAVMTITPMEKGDLALRFLDRARHGGWHVSRQPYVIKWAPKAEALIPAFLAAYEEDAQLDDNSWVNSTRFYIDHKDDFAGTVVVDPRNYNSQEQDAIHHVLNLIGFHKPEHFEVEFQLSVADDTRGEAVTADEVMGNLSGAPRCVLPEGTLQCVAFCDVNIQQGAGLRWGVLACGPQRVTSVVAYGAYPADGSALVPPRASPADRRAKIVEGMKAVVREIINLPLRIDGTNARVRPLALAFDAGYEPATVHAMVSWLRRNVQLHGMEVLCTLGRAWSQFGRIRRDEQKFLAGDHMYAGATVSKDKTVLRKYLVVHADYWREVMQRAFLAKYPVPGSCSLYGARAETHRALAEEATYEQLVEKRVDNGRQAWTWANDRPGHNHYADVLYGCFALASWKRIYAASLPPSLSAPRVGGQKQEWADDPPPPTSVPKRSPRAPHKLFRRIRRPKYVK